MRIQFVFLLIIFALTTMTIFAQEQNVILKTPTGEIGGVLLKPATNKKIPVVLLISGSGPTDKDGNQPGMQTNSLKMLAEKLRENGIASLRFDKRGIGASRAAFKQEADLRFENYIEDVSGWINLLSENKDFSQIIVAGHSEGSLIGMIASGKNNKVKKYISIAGLAIPADENLKEQLNSLPQPTKDSLFPMFDSLKKGQRINDVPPSLNSILRPSVQPYLISWFKYNPQEEIKKLTIPILILQGDKDFQVSVKNADSLKESAANAEKKIIPQMNHVLKNTDTTDKNAQIKTTYDDPTLPINADLVKDILAFIKK